ncbi:uroporphyrin-III C-methyltransferase [Physocladia obscura]|uniref:Uroporphyrin-III C-methyltransferase n=1 Tax=Physocladia obscura TaxID=109957 RepID=A0AAD5XFU8_9FUNG|nr:uroporphyrin-III C-methyltransferase [Physocladia obscura]
MDSEPLSITFTGNGRRLQIIVEIVGFPSLAQEAELELALDTFVKSGANIVIRTDTCACLPIRYSHCVTTENGIFGADFALGLCCSYRPQDIAGFVSTCRMARVPVCVPGLPALSDFFVNTNRVEIQPDVATMPDLDVECGEDSASVTLSLSSSLTTECDFVSESRQQQQQLEKQLPQAEEYLEDVNLNPFILQPPKNAQFSFTSFIPPPLEQSNSLPSLSIVGAGPGTPALLTVAAIAAIQSCSLLIVDRLVPANLIKYALTVQISDPAEINRKNGWRRRGMMPYILHTRKVPGNAPLAQQEIEDWTAAALRLGHAVVRLKGGDPFVYGRGGEEYLSASKVNIAGNAGIEQQLNNAQHELETGCCVVEPFQPCNIRVVPGLSSSLVSPLVAGIPSTHRGVADQILIATGRLEEEDKEVEWPLYAPNRTTIVLMAMGRIQRVVAGMKLANYPADLPVALVEKAGWGADQGEQVWKGTLSSVVSAVKELGLKAHATLIVGNVVTAFG